MLLDSNLFLLNLRSVLFKTVIVAKSSLKTNTSKKLDEPFQHAKISCKTVVKNSSVVMFYLNAYPDSCNIIANFNSGQK